MNPDKQCDTILRHLRAGHSITSLYALRMLGVGRLAARIHDIKARGHSIGSQFVKVSKADGTSASVKEYWLEKDETK